MYPSVAVDEFGNRGFWTMVYNQGFEVRVSGRSYFAFSLYEKVCSYNIVGQAAKMECHAQSNLWYICFVEEKQ